MGTRTASKWLLPLLSLFLLCSLVLTEPEIHQEEQLPEKEDNSEKSFFTCSKNSTLKFPIEKWCDFVPDCPDGAEDEAQCGGCIFESRKQNLCGYSIKGGL